MNSDLFMLFDKTLAALPLFVAVETNIIEASEDLDDQIMGWLRESYEFSMIKGRKRS